MCMVRILSRNNLEHAMFWSMEFENVQKYFVDGTEKIKIEMHIRRTLSVNCCLDLFNRQ